MQRTCNSNSLYETTALISAIMMHRKQHQFNLSKIQGIYNIWNLINNNMQENTTYRSPHSMWLYVIPTPTCTTTVPVMVLLYFFSHNLIKFSLLCYKNTCIVMTWGFIYNHCLILTLSILIPFHLNNII